MTKIAFRVSAVVFSLTVVILSVHSGCSKNPLQRVTGQWQRTEGNDTIELKPDRSFSVRISHSIPFIENINHAQTSVIKGELGWRQDGTWGWIVELGKLVVPYSVPAIQRVRITDEAGYQDQEVALRYVVAENDKIPTAHLPFKTGTTGNIEVLAEVDGKPITEWKTSGSSPLHLEVEIKDHWSPLDEAFFEVNTVDSELREWHGTLSLVGSFTFTENGELIAHVPVKGGLVRMELFRASMLGKELSLTSRSIEGIGGTYIRLRK